VWLLGLVKFLQRFCSELVYPLVPCILPSVPDGGSKALGIIEASAEATAALLKLFASVLSTDRVPPNIGWWAVIASICAT